NDLNNILKENEILLITRRVDADLALGLVHTETAAVALIFKADSLPEIAAYWANMANTPLICDPA
ncbi:unnamed protein product, partial [Ectocarpus sp. 12 AP-2014]